MTDVTVQLNYKSGGWKIVGPGNHDIPPNHSRIKFAGNSGEGDITFKIIGSSGAKFAKANPFIPTQIDGPSAASQFSVVSGAGTDQLVVKNLNSNSGETDYYYQLNFEGAPPIDPIITNGCCQSRLSYPLAEYALAGVAILMAVIALFAMRNKLIGR